MFRFALRCESIAVMVQGFLRVKHFLILFSFVYVSPAQGLRKFRASFLFTNVSNDRSLIIDSLPSMGETTHKPQPDFNQT